MEGFHSFQLVFFSIYKSLVNQSQRLYMCFLKFPTSLITLIILSVTSSNIDDLILSKQQLQGKPTPQYGQDFLLLVIPIAAAHGEDEDTKRPNQEMQAKSSDVE